PIFRVTLDQRLGDRQSLIVSSKGFVELVLLCEYARDPVADEHQGLRRVLVVRIDRQEGGEYPFAFKKRGQRFVELLLGAENVSEVPKADAEIPLPRNIRRIFADER